MPRPVLLIVLTALSLFATGCGGDDDAGTADVPAPVGDSAASAEPEVDTPTEPEVDLPTFASDFDRVCTTQVGFGGAAPYVTEGGPSPVLLFQETDSGTLITSSAELPAGWAVEEDSDFEDNSELAVTELVACAQVLKQAANGVSCDLEGDDGGVTTLNLVDVTYELSVYAAVTGERVGTELIEAADTDCPLFVFIDEGQTDYVNTPDEDQYINALRPYVTP